MIDRLKNIAVIKSVCRNTVHYFFALRGKILFALLLLVVISSKVDAQCPSGNYNITTCSGVAFSVIPPSVPAGTNYTWATPSGSGFLGGAPGSGNEITGITGVLTNGGTSNVTATYTVNSSGSCTGSFTVQVVVRPLPNNVSVSSGGFTGNSFCVTGGQGVFTFDADNTNFNSGSIQYSDGSTTWAQIVSNNSAYQFNAAVNPVTAGNHNYSLVSITNEFGCTRTLTDGFGDTTARITINQLPTTPIAGTDQSNCNNGSFTLTGNNPVIGNGIWSVASGTATITTPSSPTSTVTGITAGSSATLLWTMTNGTCVLSNDVILTNNANPSLSLTKTDVLCFGASTGAINITASGGVGPYTYAWTGAGVNPTAEDQTGLAAGNYSVIVTDAAGCSSVSLPVTITQPASAVTVALTSKNDILCFGTSTGAINITASGGVGPYTYAWTGTGVNPTAEDQTGLAAGNYSVIVKDANNCTTASLPVTITQPASAVTVALTSKNDILCFGTSTGAINITASGGVGTYTYSWTGAGVNPTAEDQTGLAAGNYSVIVTDAVGCSSASLPVTITQPASAVTVALTSKTDILCFGASTGAINITAAGGIGPYTYAWTGTGINPTAEDQTGLAAGNYSVIVTDAGGCSSASLPVTITQPASAVTVALTSKTDILCFGASTGAINITASGGVGPYTYAWTGAGVNPTAEDQTGLTAGNYSVIVKDANNCTTASLPVTITQPASAVTVALTSKTDILCFGASTGAINITAAGGIGPYTYAWTGTGVNPTAEDQIGLTAGSYSVIVKDANNCTTASLPVTITQPVSALTVTLTSKTDVLCFGASTGAINITASGGVSPYTYTWIGIGVNPNSEDQTGLAAGNYSVIVKDANNCTTASLPITITQPTVVAITSITSNSPVCTGNTLNLTAAASGGTGSLSYSWSGPNGFTSILQNPSIVNVTIAASGNYMLSVTDANGCGLSATTVVTVNPLPVVNITAAATICANGTTTLSPTSGGTWVSNNTSVATVNASTGVITGVAAGSATFTFTQTSTGCINTTLPVTVNALPVVSISGSSSICLNGTTQLSPASGGTWATNNPAIATVTPAGVVTGVGTGSTTFTFTNNGSPNCSATTSAVTVNALPTVSISGSSLICISGTTTLSPTSGGTWVSNNTSIATVNASTGVVTGVGAGSTTFTFTSSTAPNCSATTLPVTVNASPVVSITGSSSICINSTTTLSPTSGGTWVSNNISVATVNASTGVVTGVGAGSTTFTFTSSTAPNCSATTLPVTVNASPVVSITGSTSVCSGTTTTLSPTSGGVWVSNNTTVATVNASTGVVTGVAAGSATFTFTQTSTGCSNTTSSVTVVQSPTTANAGASQTICSTTSSVTLAANTPTVGTGAWSVVSGPSTSLAQFSSTSNPAATFTPSAGAGTYQLRWTISNPPCAASQSPIINIIVNAPPAIANAGIDKALCTTTPSIAMTGNPPGVGTGAWSVVSGPSTLTSQFSNTASATSNFTPAGGAGIYTLRWTISNNPCTPSFDDVVVTVNAAPNAGPDQGICSGTSTTLAANTPTTGTGVWTIQAGSPNTSTAQLSSTTSPTATFTPTATGSYQLRWTFGAPCSSFDAITITVSAPPTAPNISFFEPCFGCGGDVNSQTICDGILVGGGGQNDLDIYSGNFGGASYLWQYSNNPCCTWIDAPDEPSAPTKTHTSSSYQLPDPPNAYFSPIGTYYFRLRITNGSGCSSFSDNLTLTVVSSLTIEAGTDLTTCQSVPVTLSGASVGGNSSPAVPQGQWTITSLSPANGGVNGTLSNTGFQTAASGNIATTTYTPPPGYVGTVTLTLTSNDPDGAVGSGSCNALTDTRKIVVNSAPTITNSLTSNVCSGLTTNISLTSGVPSTYAWTIGTITGGITGASAGSGPTISQTLVNPGSSAGTVEYIIMPTPNSPTSCPAVSATITVTVNPAPAAVTVSGAGSFCGNATITASGGTGGTIYFQGTTSNGTSTATPSSSQVVSSSGTYYFRAQSASGCWGPQGSVAVTINPSPTANAGSAQSVCAGGSINLSGSIGGAATSATWSAPTGTFSNVNSLTSTYTPSITSGTETLTLTTNDPDGAGPCVAATSTVIITVTALPTATGVTICQGSSSASLTATAVCAGGSPTTAPFNSNGTFIVPAGVTSITVEAWGAGGGGASNGGSSSGGGGGGAYASRTIPVIPGQSYTISVGNGGGAGVAGGITYFNTNSLASTTSVVAAGGGSSTSNNGGAGGSVANSNGSTKFAGGNGGSGGSSNDGGGGGGGSALTNGNGNNGGSTSTATGGSGGTGTGNGGIGCDNDGNPSAQPGSSPGGGGGGRSDDFCTSQSGANGQVVITYTVPGSINWYTAGGTLLGSGSPFNPVGVAGSGLPNTNTPGTTTFYAACSSTPGCRTAADFIIRPTPTATISGTATVCQNGSSPTVTFTNPQTQPITVTYNINGIGTTTINIGASTTATIAAPTGTPGTFIYNLVSVVYQTAPTCSAPISGSAVITVTPTPSASISGTTSACQNGTAPVITFTNPQNSAVTITYNINGGSNTTINIGPNTSSTVTAPTGTVGTFTYNLVSVVYQAAPTCSNPITGSATVTVGLLPTVFTVNGGGNYCSGSSGVTVGLSGSELGVNYQLQINGVNTGSPVPGTSAPLDFGLQTAAGTYTITATNATSSCLIPMTGFATVSVTPTPTATISGTASVCQNDAGPLITFTNPQAAPVTIIYNINGGANLTINVGANTTATVTAPTNTVGTLTYNLVSVAYQSAPFCSNPISGSQTVTVNPGGTPTFSFGLSLTICSGAAVPTLPGSSIEGIAGTWSPATVSNTASGNYTFTPTAGQCSSSVTLTVTVNPTPTITGTSNACVGTTIQLAGSGTPAISNPWVSATPSVATVDDTGLVTAVGIGTSVITYTNSSGCIATTTVTMNPPLNFVVTPVASACSPPSTVNLTSSTITAGSDPGLTYTYWTDAAATVSYSTPGLATTGTYFIKGTNASGCFDIKQIVVEVNPKPTVGIIRSPNTLCFGASNGVMTAVPSLGTSPYTFIWSTGQTTNQITGLSTGTYTVTVTDSKGCTATSPPNTYNQQAALAAPTVSQTQPTCIVTTGTITVNTPAPAAGITYSIDGVAYTNTNGIFPGLTPGNYNVTFKNSSGCISPSVPVAINAAIIPTAILSGNATICSGASTTISIALTGTAPWSITYTDGTTPVTVNGIATSPYTFSVSPAANTTYSITAVSDASCTGTFSGSALVSVNTAPTATISGNATLCSGASTTISVALTGTAPWSITYTDGTTPVTVSGIATSPYTFSVSPAANTTYSITSISDASCTGTFSGSALVSVNTAPTATISGNATLCSGASTTISIALTGTAPWSITYTDGTTPVTVNGIATSPYTFSVSPAANTTYSITAVSDASCTGTFSGSALVTINPVPTCNITGLALVTPNSTGNGYSVTVSPLGGTVTYSWSISAGGTIIGGTNGSSINVTAGASGTYTVSVNITRDGCPSSCNLLVTIDNPCATPPTAFNVTGDGSYCAGDPGLPVGLNGSESGVNYQLYNGVNPIGIPVAGTGSLISFGLQTGAGVYTVVATNSTTSCTNNMSGSATIIVNPKPAPVLIYHN